MGWSIGWDEKWKRDIGYGVPAICDQPGCDVEIDHGLSYVCGGEAYGGDRGCGLFFCGDHRQWFEKLPELCDRCAPRLKTPYQPKADSLKWLFFKMTDESWADWRKENGLTTEEK